uniref:Uncharacterized protein n=1 Tax=Marseillevirus LCMAC201 TaxID=2506605 RepID=A0A481YWZ1_9VIRU|nr:MAG: hypothetical protein LCMAC201_03070 [Marseillevirus LCMAC201]
MSFDDLLFRVLKPDGKLENVPFHSSRLQNLTSSYRKELQLDCQVSGVGSGQGDYTLKAIGLSTVVSRVVWWAAKTGDKFPTVTDAYQNTTNIGVVPVRNGEFTINFNYPGSYYENGQLGVPHIHLGLCGPDGTTLHVLTVDLDVLPNLSYWSWTKTFIVLTILLIVILLFRSTFALAKVPKN